jgi:hypothetical protein
MKFRILYTIKEKDGLLVDKKITFNEVKMATDYMKKVTTVGKYIIEEIK